MSLWVYILQCSDKTLYTGIANNLDRRFGEHQFGINAEAYTFTRRPVKLVFAEQFIDYKLAHGWEKRLKGWSAKKKWALIEDNWKKMRELAICKNESHFLNRPKADDLL